MNRLAALSLALIGSGATASAQIYIADPLDNPASSTSNVIPLSPSTTFDESRAHHFFPAAYLPGAGGVITGIEFAMTANATTPYQLLEFSFDHTANATLSTTFANNLTAPTVVYSITNQSVTYTSGWYLFPLQTPFTYDGNSNLVLETRKIIDRPLPPVGSSGTRVLIYPRRIDTIPPVWAYGAFGSGQASAAVATTTYNTEVLIRLHFASGPTLTINSTRDVTGNANRSYYHVGATVTLANHGTPAAPYATFFEAALLPVGIPIPGLGGELWVPSLSFLIDSGALDGSGQSSFAATIPSDPTLVGLQAHFQSIVIGGTIDFTNIVKAPVAAY